MSVWSADPLNRTVFCQSSAHVQNRYIEIQTQAFAHKYSTEYNIWVFGQQIFPNTLRQLSAYVQIQIQRQAQIQILIHLQQMREPPSVSWSTPSNQFIVTKYCFSAQVRSGLYLYPNLYFICIGPRLHFMQKDIWAEILSLPLSDNQSDLADVLKPNLCQRPLNHDFHTLGNILFYCCPPRIGEPRHSGSAVEQVKLNKDNTI